MPIHSWHWGTEKAFSCLRVATIQKTFPGLITVKLNRWFTASERRWEMFVTYSLLKQEHLEIKYFKTMHWCFLTEKTFAFKNKFSQLHSFLFFLGRTFFFCLLKIVILTYWFKWFFFFLSMFVHNVQTRMEKRLEFGYCNRTVHAAAAQFSPHNPIPRRQGVNIIPEEV